MLRVACQSKLTLKACRDSNAVTLFLIFGPQKWRHTWASIFTCDYFVNLYLGLIAHMDVVKLPFGMIMFY